jgi:hypothetical protein
LVKHVGDFLPADANDHAIGLHEVLDRRALFEKLGIARHVAIAAGKLAEHAGDPRTSADWHGALRYYHRVSPQMRGERFHDAPESRQVRSAIGALRRADGQINDVGRLDRRR